MKVTPQWVKKHDFKKTVKREAGCCCFSSLKDRAFDAETKKRRHMTPLSFSFYETVNS
jgi:hypothetical protein